MTFELVNIWSLESELGIFLWYPNPPLYLYPNYEVLFIIAPVHTCIIIIYSWSTKDISKPTLSQWIIT